MKCELCNAEGRVIWNGEDIYNSGATHSLPLVIIMHSKAVCDSCAREITCAFARKSAPKDPRPQ